MVLASLTTTEHDELSPYLEEVRISSGEYLFRPGDLADAVFFLKSGRVGVQTSTGFEDRQQVVALLDPGAAVGEKGLTAKGSREMAVIVIEDSVLYSLGMDAFSKLEKSHPDLAFKILKRLLNISALRLRASSKRLAHVL